MSSLLLLVIRGWQRIVSDNLPPMCRFYPSCSRYTAEAIAIWGPWSGSWMGLRRIARCNPLHPGGHDPVPPRPGPAQESS